jgi:myo-inositol-1(or 4)-monophosphatase
MPMRSALINVMARAAEKAAKALIRDFGEVEHLQVSRKGPGNFVSTADLKAQETLRQELARARPEFGFIMEEGDFAATDKPLRWIIDPIDGTTNFLHGIPHWAISIAAAEGDQLLAGIVFNPITDEMFWAEKGLGAYCNHRRLRVSARDDLSASLIATGIPFKGHPVPEFYSQMERVAPQVAGIRRFGAASLDLAYVAAGRFEAYWETGIKIWDVAAGILLVTEAGGSVTSLRANQAPLVSGALLASNGALHASVQKLLMG